MDYNWVGPCGNCACEKYADCPYCAKCVENDPYAAQAAEINAELRWERENAGSFSEWFANR